jgi:hypothetical protein
MNTFAVAWKTQSLTLSGKYTLICVNLELEKGRQTISLENLSGNVGLSLQITCHGALRQTVSKLR